MQPTFDNTSFIVIDKPAGWLSIPSRTGQSDPRPCAGRMLEREIGQRLWPVHRLDQEVSGLLLFARTAEAHRAASLWFERHQIHKRYEAWTECQTGNAPPPGMVHEWESCLLRGKKRAYESPHGKVARTRAIQEGPLARTDGPAVLRWTLHPRTGRPHQLRYELARHGFPIVGDTLYGAAGSYRPEAIALRAVLLDFAECPGRQELGLPVRLQVPGLDLPLQLPDECAGYCWRRSRN